MGISNETLGWGEIGLKLNTYRENCHGKIGMSCTSNFHALDTLVSCVLKMLFRLQIKEIINWTF